MSVAAIDALQSIGAFLNDKLLGAVPASLKSDVRAAAKLLQNALAELDAMYPTLIAECEAMAEFCQAAGAVDRGDEGLRRIAAAAETLAAKAPDGAWRLQDLAARHAEWSALTGDISLALQLAAGAGNQAAAALLSRLLATLGQHASVRSAWQSVFPADKPFSDILIEP